jgi:hypothetical protein
MEKRLSEIITIRLTPTLKYQLYELAGRFRIKPMDAARLGLYQLVERYPPGCGQEKTDEFHKEIGALGFRDDIFITESIDDEPEHELNAKDAYSPPESKDEEEK